MPRASTACQEIMGAIYVREKVERSEIIGAKVLRYTSTGRR